MCLGHRLTGVRLRDTLSSCTVAYLESTPLLDSNNSEELGGGAVATVASLPATDVMPLVLVERQLSLETLETVNAFLHPGNLQGRQLLLYRMPHGASVRTINLKALRCVQWIQSLLLYNITDRHWDEHLPVILSTVWERYCMGAILYGSDTVWKRYCMGAILYGSDTVWERYCMGAIQYGSYTVWEQYCMGAILYGSNTVYWER
jgi:hypothetical protein